MSSKQKHKDRLSALDASFFFNESSSVRLHAGAILIFEGTPIKYEQLVNHVRSRLHLFPRVRQKLAIPPLKTGRPIWIDDVNFDLEYHIRQNDLPQHGSEKELQDLLGKIFSQELDYAKPLWEFWLVRGLSDNRFALICKLHHSLVDGISGVNLSTILFDLEPDPKPIQPPNEQWKPQPEPSRMEMAIDGIGDYLKQLLTIPILLFNTTKLPVAAFQRLRTVLRGLSAVARAFFFDPAPDTFLNVDIDRGRRLDWATFELNQFKQIKKVVDGTVNDVVLAVVADALAKFFDRRGQRTDGVELKALVPVSIRSLDDQSLFGNSMSVIPGPLPLDVQDPLQLLREVHKKMDDIKESKQAVGANLINATNDFLPPILLARTSHLNYSTRFFNLVVTNLPGIQFPLYVLGHKLLDFFPVTCLPQHHALAISILSYNDIISFCFLADSDVLPDLHKLREDTEQAFAELYKAAVNEAAPTFDGDDGKIFPYTGDSKY